GDLVVLLPQEVGVEDSAGGGQGVHRGVDALLSDGSLEHDEGVEVGEGGGGGGVGQVVRGDVDGLDGGDRALVGGGDALLELAHLGAQGGLVAHGAGHAAQEGGHFRAGLGEAEDVV